MLSAMLAFIAFRIPAQVQNPTSVPQLTGKAVDEQGRPVVGAEVECYFYQNSTVMMGDLLREPVPSQHAVTDNNGAFKIDAGSGNTLVVVRKPGLAPAWKTWTFPVACFFQPSGN